MSVLYGNLGGAWKALGEYKKAIEYYELALRSDLKTYGKLHPSVADRCYGMGAIYSNMEEWNKSMKNLSIAKKIYLKFLPENHSTLKNIDTWIESVKDSLKNAKER